MEKLNFIVFVSFILIIPQIVLAQKQKADLIISGGIVVTMDANRRVIENGAVVVVGDKIAAVGTAAEIAAKYTSKQKINAAGKVVIPGFNQHAHARSDVSVSRHRRRFGFAGLADEIYFSRRSQKRQRRFRPRRNAFGISRIHSRRDDDVLRYVLF